VFAFEIALGAMQVTFADFVDLVDDVRSRPKALP